MNNREGLVKKWGQEVVLKCCKYWLCHYAEGKWGSCGICKQKPVLCDNLSWDDVQNSTS